LKRETRLNGRIRERMASGSTLRKELSQQGPSITGGIGILIEKNFSMHLLSIARITYLIHSTFLLSPTCNFRRWRQSWH
jgi:hypothetical protein